MTCLAAAARTSKTPGCDLCTRGLNEQRESQRCLSTWSSGILNVRVIGQSNATSITRDFVTMEKMFVDLTRKFQLESQRVLQQIPQNVIIQRGNEAHSKEIRIRVKTSSKRSFSEAIPEVTESALPDNLAGISDDAMTGLVEVDLAESTIEQH